MKTIAFIHPDLGIGGAERLVLDVASALTQLNYKVIFLTNHFDKTHAFEELRTEQYPVYVYGDWLPRSICGKFQALCAYIRMIYLTVVYRLFVVRYKDVTAPDIYFIDLIPVAAPLLKLFGEEKVVYYCHHPDLLASSPGGLLKQFYRKPIDWLEQTATAHADTILVNSEYTAAIFRRTFPQITKPIRVVYPTVSKSYEDMVCKQQSDKTVRRIDEIIPEIPSVTNRNLIFLSINRFHPAKQLDLAIRAMDRLKASVSADEWSRIYLIVAGGFDPQSSVNANYYSELIKLTKAKQLEDKVIFLKSPSDSVKTDLLIGCDCVVYTPVREHFGIVPLEAMTASKPVIACNSGGPRETVEHGVNGFLCEPQPDSLAEFMRKMLDKDAAEEMGRKGKRVLERQFSYKRFLGNLENVFNHLNK